MANHQLMSEDIRSIISNPELLLQIFYDCPFGICLIGKDGYYLEVNQGFVDILGYETRDEFLSKTFADITHPDDVDLDRELTMKIFSGAIEKFEIEKRFIKKDKQVTWARLYATIFNKEIGIGILEPLSERGKVENKLAKLKKDLDQFVYKTSHDLRAPVTNIISLSEIEHEELNLEDRIKMINEDARKLDHIIREITDYAANQKFPLKYERLDIDELLDQVCESALKEVRKSRIPKIVRQNRISNCIIADKGRLVLISKNLLMNAINFTDEKGQVEICVENDDEGFMMRFRDEGVGIRKDVQAKIYEMFFRGSNISEGAGLGLYIVKEALQELNGTISFNSQLDKGSEFTVHIPALQASN